VDLKQEIRRAAGEAGLPVIGFAPVAALPHERQLQRWVARGMAADMKFMTETAHLRHHPTELMAGARSAIVAALPHETGADPGRPGVGLVARYARGRDYHAVLQRRLRTLAAALDGLAGRPVRSRVAVDTSPIHERELAAAAGIGFIGKNTMLIRPGLGSYLVLGVLLVDLELEPDPRDPVRRCGRCELCIEACPGGALVGPYEVDARRCISCLTIERRGALPAGTRLAPWVFGCDRCQEVCPYNARAGRELTADPELSGPAELPLAELLRLRSGAYRRLARGRALARAPRAALIRNAALVAGQQLRACRDPALAASLVEALGELRDHADPGVSAAARRALAGAGHDHNGAPAKRR